MYQERRVTSQKTESSQIPKEYRRKAYFLTQFLNHGATPNSPEGKRLISNVIRMGENLTGERDTLSTKYTRLLSSPNTPDRFDWQKHGEDFTSVLLKDTENFDMIDLIFAIKASSIFFTSLAEGNHISDRFRQRFSELNSAYLQQLVYAVTYLNVRGEDEISLENTHNQLFNDDAIIGGRLAQGMIRDRIIISDLSLGGGLWNKNEKNGESAYSREPSPRERERLTTESANTLERLHLLKAYGVTPFEVPHTVVGLPWDIAVVPPLNAHSLDKDGYAEGAVADFLLLTPDQNRSNILFDYQTDSDRTTTISVGDAETLMRFRLHDNGQISHGLMYHNTPSDVTELAFIEAYAKNAFERLRGLFISLAFDALVPEEVITRRTRGSVATNYARQPQESIDRRITELLLQRTKVLKEAKITEHQRTPQDWPSPQADIRGYLKRVPEGTKVRRDAEKEAREYFHNINIRFDGLPEGYTFVRPYSRGRGQENIPYRRASFRKSSKTKRFLNDNT